MAFRHPLEHSLLRANLYVQRGTFSYTARVEPGAAYQTTRVTTGDPVFLQLVHRLPIAFDYRLRAAQQRDVHGTARLTAVLTDGQGWRHRLVLAPERRFAGPATTVRGVLDLQELQRTIQTFERETGERNPIYHVDLKARVSVRGTVDAEPLVASFGPKLQLDLDSLRLAPAATPSPGSASSSFAQSQTGAGTRVVPATLHALGRSVTVGRARSLAELLGVAGLVLAAVGGSLMLLGRRGDEVDGIRRRYDDWIVDVMPDPERAAAERRVSSMDALARLAQRYDRLILHECRRDADAFLIDDHGVVYAYVVRRWSPSTELVTS